MDFTRRAVDEELVGRYLRDGFWSTGSLGQLLAGGLHEAREEVRGREKKRFSVVVGPRFSPDLFGLEA